MSPDSRPTAVHGICFDLPRLDRWTVLNAVTYCFRLEVGFQELGYLALLLLGQIERASRLVRVFRHGLRLCH